jgi:hypothetical protein
MTEAKFKKNVRRSTATSNISCFTAIDEDEDGETDYASLGTQNDRDAEFDALFPKVESSNDLGEDGADQAKLMLLQQHQHQ